MKRNFRELLEARWSKGCFVCVGLDSEWGKIPERFGSADVTECMLSFNKWVIDQTHDIVCCYKPNLAFYLAEGIPGLLALQLTVRHILDTAPGIPVILDAKWADIGNTNEGYVKMAFDYLQTDAVTVHPYLGREALEPFLKHADKGVFVLCKTSNPGAGEFQDAHCEHNTLSQAVADHVSEQWNANGNCGLVVGATYPVDLQDIRGLVGDDIPLLIPGIGAQGGDLERTVKAGKNSRGTGIIINSSRGIIFAPDPRAETKKLNDSITSFL